MNAHEPDDRHNDLVKRSFGRQVGLFTGPDSLFASRDDATRWLGDLSPDLVVLEVACGAAHLAEVTAPNVHQIVAIDLTPELLALAAQRLIDAGIRNVLLQQGDAESLPFADGSFDLAYCRASLHHMMNPTQAIAEMARVCRPHGRIVISDLIAPSAEIRATFDATHRLLDPSHTRTFLYDELGDMFPPDMTVTAASAVTRRLPLDIAVTPLGDRDRAVAELRQEIDGGPPTGFDPSDDHGTLIVSFTTQVVEATFAPPTETTPTQR